MASERSEKAARKRSASRGSSKASSTRKAAPKSQRGKATARSPSRRVDASVGERADWRRRTLSLVRALIEESDPDVVEESKWKKPSNPAGVPVWSHDGILCTGETYKDKVKLTFARGASLEDPAELFNAGLAGNTRRAIDLHEGDEIDERAFKALVRSAVALNAAGRRK